MVVITLLINTTYITKKLFIQSIAKHIFSGSTAKSVATEPLITSFHQQSRCVALVGNLK